MKKILATLAILPCSLQAATIFQLIPEGTGSGCEGITAIPVINGNPSSAVSGQTSIFNTKLTDGTAIDISITSGRGWFADAADTWTNAEALKDFNAFTGLTLSQQDINNLCFYGTGAGTGTTSLTLNFSGNTSIQAGDQITLYAFMGASGGILSNITISGLEQATVSYAADTATGFADSLSPASANDGLLLVKVTGTLGDDQQVRLSSSTVKNAYALVAYLPEPSTASLSLLALAGLVLRRRRP